MGFSGQFKNDQNLQKPTQQNPIRFYQELSISIRLPQIRAANFVHLGSKIVTLGSNFVIFLGSKKFFFFGQRNYFFEQQDYSYGQQILMGKAANFISKGSRFYRDQQQFLLKWAANIFNEITFYIKLPLFCPIFLIIIHKNDGYII